RVAVLGFASEVLAQPVVAADACDRVYSAAEVFPDGAVHSGLRGVSVRVRHRDIHQPVIAR
ncbi:hypothetical protein KBZ21_40280, partial [Streptomyces sp. A73]|nr:hypothetical protein [Streptomyces sp. A73]